MYKIRRKRDYLAAVVIGLTVILSLSYPIISLIFLIVASILDVNRAI
jgi:hypothetical protein